MRIEEIFKEILDEEKLSKFKNSYEFKKYKESILNDAKEFLTPSDRVFLSRYKNRPKAKDFIENIIDDPIYFKGDRCFKEDSSIICGIGKLDDEVVTFIGINKGRDFEESIKCNFGMVNPEGYRKAVRIMKQAEKFKRPIICFVDTPGAYPGVGAEERGQAEAIAKSIYTMAGINTNTVSVITGEGASGGAIALCVCDHLIMMENAIYSILSPEGFASILWRDSGKVDKAIEIMKLTSKDLYKFKICDEVIEEDLAPTQEDFFENYSRLKNSIVDALKKLKNIPKDELLKNRREKYRSLEWGLK